MLNEAASYKILLLRSASKTCCLNMNVREMERCRMKNIIIAGTGRAGKSTLARKIGEALNYFVINNDRLVATFGEAYPQLNHELRTCSRKMV